MKIVIHPHPALRYKSVPVTRFDRELRDTARAMFDLMYENRGIGLAANQVGLPYQMFVLNLTADPESPDDELVFINPEILKRQATDQDEEGCLSFPGLYGKVLRAKKIRVRALDLDGNPFEIDADDLFARAIQHEADHIKGSLFIDKFSTLGRLAAAKRIKEIEAAYQALRDAGEYPDDAAILRELDALADRMRTRADSDSDSDADAKTPEPRSAPANA